MSLLMADGRHQSEPLSRTADFNTRQSQDRGAVSTDLKTTGHCWHNQGGVEGWVQVLAGLHPRQQYTLQLCTELKGYFVELCREEMLRVTVITFHNHSKDKMVKAISQTGFGMLKLVWSEYNHTQKPRSMSEIAQTETAARRAGIPFISRRLEQQHQQEIA